MAVDVHHPPGPAAGPAVPPSVESGRNLAICSPSKLLFTALPPYLKLWLDYSPKHTCMQGRRFWGKTTETCFSLAKKEEPPGKLLRFPGSSPSPARNWASTASQASGGSPVKRSLAYRRPHRRNSGILFDQLGVMRSDAIAEDESYGMEYQIEMVEEMRKLLGIEKWSILGHSYATGFSYSATLIFLHRFLACSSFRLSICALKYSAVAQGADDRRSFAADPEDHRSHAVDQRKV